MGAISSYKVAMHGKSTSMSPIEPLAKPPIGGPQGSNPWMQRLEPQATKLGILKIGVGDD